MDAKGLSARYELRFMAELQRIRGASPQSKTGHDVLAAGVAVFEELLQEILSALGDETSALRKELDARNVHPDWVRSQVGAAAYSAREAQRANRPGLLKKAAAGLGTLLLYVGAGASGGATQGIVGAHMNPPSVVEQYGHACTHLGIVMEQHDAGGDSEGFLGGGQLGNTPTHQSVTLQDEIGITAEVDPQYIDAVSDTFANPAVVHPPAVETQPPSRITDSAPAIDSIASKPSPALTDSAPALDSVSINVGTATEVDTANPVEPEDDWSPPDDEVN
jgi:hypothetical protein